MRYPHVARTPRMTTLNRLSLSLLLSCAALTGGCGPDKHAKEDLVAGFAALEAQQFDDAYARAEGYLGHVPNGPGTAEALYLKGRALEQKPAANPAQARTNLQAARAAYVEAFAKQPSKKLEAYLHTSLANVAYFLDDYTTAINEWTTAHGMLEDEDTKSWVLYRIGVSRQRLGQFAEADEVLAAVQERHGGTLPAQRAKEKMGARGFSVQLATYANTTAADATVGTLKQEGVAATKQADPKGRTVVFVGPLPSYQQALGVKARYAGKYPDAVIVP
jgi:tetratricopeptide (TPR) repeat protein